jgi:hypothetical protein
MKTYEEVEVRLRAFLSSTVDGDEKATSRPGRFTPAKETDTHWIGGRVGPTAGLNTAVAKRKNPFPAPAGN